MYRRTLVSIIGPCRRPHRATFSLVPTNQCLCHCHLLRGNRLIQKNETNKLNLAFFGLLLYTTLMVLTRKLYGRLVP